MTPWRPKSKPVPAARRVGWILPGLMLLAVAIFSVIGMVTVGVFVIRWAA